MTVAELIAELQKYPPDMEVYTANEMGEPDMEIYTVLKCSKRHSTLFPKLNDPTQVVIIH